MKCATTSTDHVQRCFSPPPVSAPTSLEAVVDMRHHAHLIILVEPTLYIKFPNGVRDIRIRVYGLKDRHV